MWSEGWKGSVWKGGRGTPVSYQFYASVPGSLAGGEKFVWQNWTGPGEKNSLSRWEVKVEHRSTLQRGSNCTNNPVKRFYVAYTVFNWSKSISYLSWISTDAPKVKINARSFSSMSTEAKFKNYLNFVYFFFPYVGTFIERTKRF